MCVKSLEMYRLYYNTVVWANRTIATTSNNERSGEPLHEYREVRSVIT